MNLPVQTRSSAPTKNVPWNSIQTVMAEIKIKKQNSRSSMKHTQYSEIQQKNPTTTDSVLPKVWAVLVVEDFSEDSTLETSEISFHSSSVEDSVVGEVRESELISEKISRCV